jgi:signal transduction histidine kinase
MPDLIPDSPPPTVDTEALISPGRYRKILLLAVLTVSVVAIGPLLLVTGLDYSQSKDAFGAEQARQRILRVDNASRTLLDFLEQRSSALEYVARDEEPRKLQEEHELSRVLRNLQQSFGGFSDLGIVGRGGDLIGYSGPFELAGRSYLGSPGFLESMGVGVHISDVFLGHRDAPHFVLSVRKRFEAYGEIVLRASIDSEVLTRVVHSLRADSAEDAFILNREGVLQTPSRRHGSVLELARPPLPVDLEDSGQVDYPGGSEGQDVLSYAAVSGSPFVVALVAPASGGGPGLATLRRNLLLFLVLSAILVLGVVVWGARKMVDRMKEADLQRAAAYHRMEYSNKMAALGRLSAGVAHEINNPVAVISEKAGLFKDLLELADAPPPKEKMVDLLDSVLNSAERCGTITHRLLGFARHMEVEAEEIELDSLLREVLSFLEKEASYRRIEVTFDVPENLPTIHSDQGQLQQVFLNILNNAFAAVDDGGRIDIGMAARDARAVEVWIQDDGVGIPDEVLSHIFEPFFSTKKGTGTGLGLSITYGIMRKLGGDVSAQSRVGEGTRFTVVLPLTDGKI